MKRFILLNKTKGLLFVVLILGAIFRLYGLNWDQGFHLHPDERAIVMFTTPLQFPKNLDEFLSPQSSWNPHFFAYGNFPLYLLKTVGLIAGNFDPSLALYDKINLVGRFISALSDLGTIIILFLLTKKILNKNIALLASFFYAISVFPIQAAHFYAVDTLLTFFIILTLYQLIRLYERPSVKNSILSGVFFGLSLATKTSATVLIVAVGTAIFADFLLIFIKNPHRPHIWFPHVPKLIKTLLTDGLIIMFVTIITFILFEPYALIDFNNFWQQTMQQRQMTYDAFTFPYTLQYVGKIPYLYELKNIFLWGQGPILATLSFLGVLYITSLLIRTHLRGVPQAQHHLGGVKRSHLRGGRMDSSKVFGESLKTMKQLNNSTMIILIFFWVYFFVVGKFAVGWMRYLLPLYPLLSLFGATFVLKVLIPNINRIISKQFSIFNFQFSIGLLVVLVFIGSILLWPLSFMHIYTKPNTRVLASQWVYQNIPVDKTIAREHWDDGLPIGGNIAYRSLELPIYEMENPIRESQIYQMAQQADYIIIASNRLYVPLQKLAKNCQKWNLPPERCSHNANRYYEKLFSGELGFKKVAEFSVFPQLSILNFQLSIDDSSADESFTVYDHPKVMIFKKISLL